MQNMKLKISEKRKRLITNFVVHIIILIVLK